MCSEESKAHAKCSFVDMLTFVSLYLPQLLAMAQSRIVFNQPTRSVSGNVSRRTQRQNSASSFDHAMLPDERDLEEDVYGERRELGGLDSGRMSESTFRTVEHESERGSTSTKSGKEPLLPRSGEVPAETKKQKVRGRGLGERGGS